MPLLSQWIKKAPQGCFFLERITGREPTFYNHGTAVYIIKTEFCISPTQSVVYHHCEREYSLRLMICTFGDDILAKADDIPLLSQWIKKHHSLGLLMFRVAEGVDPYGYLQYNHGTAVYIIKTEFCISPTQSVAYHHCEREYSLTADDIHLR